MATLESLLADAVLTEEFSSPELRLKMFKVAYENDPYFRRQVQWAPLSKHQEAKVSSTVTIVLSGEEIQRLLKVVNA